MLRTPTAHSVIDTVLTERGAECAFNCAAVSKSVVFF